MNRALTRTLPVLWALAAAAPGCAGGPETFSVEETGQRTRILAMRRALHATRLATSRPEAERSAAAACTALRALKTEGEVRRAVTEIDQHPGFVAQIAMERSGTVSGHVDGKPIVERPQVYLVTVVHVLMRIEVDPRYAEVRSAELEVLRLEEPLRLLADTDFRVAATAPQTLPAHYRATPALAAFVRERALELIDRVALPDAAKQRMRDGMPLLFTPGLTTDRGLYAFELLEEFLGAGTPMRNTRVAWIIDALKNTDLPQGERLWLLRRMLRDGTSVDELLTVFDAQAEGAGFVMRRLGLATDIDVRAAAAMVLPPGSQVIPAHALLGSEGAALAALMSQLNHPDLAVRTAAALAWEGVPGISLGDYDPRSAEPDRAGALKDLDDRIAAVRVKQAAGTPTEPEGAGSRADPLNPFAKPTGDPEPPSLPQRAVMRSALRAAGLLCDDFIRQLGRAPVSMLDVYEAYRKNHPWGGCHDAGDGRLIHEPSTYHFDVRARPGSKALTVWAVPPQGTGAASYYWDNTSDSIKVVRPK